MPKSPLETIKIGTLTAEDYSVLWGCDPSFDRAPNHKGDGELFYWFGDINQKRTVEQLAKFLGAINRTIQSIKLNRISAGQRTGEIAKDLRQLTQLRVHVQNLIAAQGAPAHSLDAVADACLACALWSSSYGRNGDIPFDSRYGVKDIHPETRKRIIEMCRNFILSNHHIIQQAGLTASDVGHDLWLSAQGHGSGFWDRDLGEIGQTLTDQAKVHGPRYGHLVLHNKKVHYQ